MAGSGIPILSCQIYTVRPAGREVDLRRVRPLFRVFTATGPEGGGSLVFVPECYLPTVHVYLRWLVCVGCFTVPGHIFRPVVGLGTKFGRFACRLTCFPSGWLEERLGNGVKLKRESVGGGGGEAGEGGVWMGMKVQTASSAACLHYYVTILTTSILFSLQVLQRDVHLLILP